ncbi:helix-turn-helix domain-containing protein [Saccharopolyspora sp. 6V]|uniref:helix-turn-helix domain-containing protein n=1 Tax=Saccharopolyspora sp. 6V TaxID=2877239 RepID=UPI001CD76741|nr:helix-turn-helix domain-containing protein [Saccharopolyspora sp. 6V]MCA1195114.1 helix-turn-helix domain-containing protein [Saccharopolyspora sp. 6V]
MTTIARDITDHWRDDVAIERALTGRDVGRPLTIAERRALFVAMHRRGDPGAQIAAALGLNGPTYRQWKNELAP